MQADMKTHTPITHTQRVLLFDRQNHSVIEKLSLKLVSDFRKSRQLGKTNR